MPVCASFGTKSITTPFKVIKPLIDVNAKNSNDSVAAKAGSKMDFSEPGRAPMIALNEIIWKSVKGKDSVMPPPVHRFRSLIDGTDSKKTDGDKD